jgi:hypothetical protein
MFELFAISVTEIVGLLVLHAHIKSYFKAQTSAKKRAKLKQRLRAI